MIRIIGCILDQHDLRLVALAFALCVSSCAAAMAMFARARVAQARARMVWIWCCGAVAGFGIWATHFVAMLAYRTSFPIAFAPGLTLLSMLIAAGMCAVGFRFALGRAGGVVGGLVTGLAIAAMHYVGMMAIEAPADQVWDPRYVIASVAVGVFLMAIGMHVVARRHELRSYVAGAAIFTLAICAMHFAGMTAFALRPDPTVAVPELGLKPGMLAIVIAAAAFLIMAVSMVGVLLDVQQSHVREVQIAYSKLEQLTAELAAALEESQSAGRAKATFFAAMSHELRTPLNAVIGFSELLGTQLFGPLGDERYVQYVHDIHSGGLRLLNLVNDVLDISRLDAGKFPLRESTFPVGDVFSGALRMVEEDAMRAGVSLVSHVAPGTPQLTADSKRIEQALLNLLSNAIKFTPKGGRVDVTAAAEPDGFKIRVTDTGIGIAEADLPKIFERFVQVDNSLSRRYEGAGLGLPICKQLAELHGGTIGIESTPHMGTTATIVLPSSRIVANSLAA